MFQITAAHICYLIAEANFESYSDTARLCLLGADHWKLPRTYASPEAIQVLSIIHALSLSSFLEMVQVSLDTVVGPCRTHAFNEKGLAPYYCKMVGFSRLELKGCKMVVLCVHNISRSLTLQINSIQSHLSLLFLIS